MSRGVVVASLCAVALAQVVAAVPVAALAPAMRPAVIGGQPTTIDQHPWQVLVRSGERMLCGGALVSSTWALTAAHCVRDVDPTAITLYAGIDRLDQRSDQTRLPIAEVIVHPQADDTTYANDVALLRLAAPVLPSARLQAVALPRGQDPVTFPTVGGPATVTGWGQLTEGGPSPDQLQAATVTVLSGITGPCGDYGPLFNGAAHICAGAPGGAIDTCSGDSGGPLVVDLGGTPTLAGVTSVGHGCARPGYPGLYTRVTSVLPWIEQVAAELVAGPPAPPLSVAARALANGRAVVTWQAAPGPAASTYRVTAQPGAAECTTATLRCTITGLTPGRLFAFEVHARNPAGTSAASPTSVPITAADAAVRVGASVRLAKVRTQAGASSASARVRTKTASICRVGPAHVEAVRSGMCRLSVAGGRRAVYIAVS